MKLKQSNIKLETIHANVECLKISINRHLAVTFINYLGLGNRRFLGDIITS